MSQDTSTDDREVEASERLAEVFDASMIDALLADAAASGTPIDGVDGLLNQMTKAVLERVLEAEMTHELGYERGDPTGYGSGNSRNGHSTKMISTPSGPVTIKVPRDRTGDFEPRIVPKKSRRLGQIDEMILSLYARGMTTRDIEAHLREVYGIDASRELISNVTDVVADEIELWRNRPVESLSGSEHLGHRQVGLDHSWGWQAHPPGSPLVIFTSVSDRDLGPGSALGARLSRRVGAGSTRLAGSSGRRVVGWV